MARNAIESDFRSSKMAAGSHFVNKKSCVLIWNGEKCDLIHGNVLCYYLFESWENLLCLSVINLISLELQTCAIQQ